jgi:hypothetical protein
MRVVCWFDSTTGHAVNNSVFVSPSWAHRAEIEMGGGAHLSYCSLTETRILAGNTRRHTRLLFQSMRYHRESLWVGMLWDSCGFISGGGRGPRRRPEVGPWWGTEKSHVAFGIRLLCAPFLMARCIGLSSPNNHPRNISTTKKHPRNYNKGNFINVLYPYKNFPPDWAAFSPSLSLLSPNKYPSVFCQNHDENYGTRE